MKYRYSRVPPGFLILVIGALALLAGLKGLSIYYGFDLAALLTNG